MQYNSAQTQTLDVDATVGQWNTASTQTHATRVTTNPHSGTACLQVVTDAGNTFGNFRAWTASPGYDLTVAGGSATSAKQVVTWLRTDTGTKHIDCKVTWVAADGTTITGTTTYASAVAVGTTWVKVDSGSITPPASTKYANVNYSIAEAGSTVFADDMVFQDFVVTNSGGTGYPTTQTAGLESTGVGEWATATSVTLAKSTAQAHTGTGSLLATPSATFTSFFARPSYPGYTLNAGNKTLSIWARANTSTLLELRLTWYDSGQNVLSSTTHASQTVPATTWTKLDGGTTITPPAGAVYATVVCYIDANTPVYWDDLVFADTAASTGGTGGGSTTPTSITLWKFSTGSFTGVGHSPVKLMRRVSGAWVQINL